MVSILLSFSSKGALKFWSHFYPGMSAGLHFVAQLSKLYPYAQTGSLPPCMIITLCIFLGLQLFLKNGSTNLSSPRGTTLKQKLF